ncbi:MAG: hypothetical protein LBN98_05690 [Prevotellaceae bacterium]|jgi:uncharacterized protein YfaS (alpha-2-macroglobulin family)|nr:hypothetical protein [Prevotellaceae bacterium]
MKRLFPLLAGLAAVVMHNGCGGAGTPAQQQSNPYIDAYTGGVVSVETVIKVRLTQSRDNVESHQEITGKLFKISPSVEGVTYWVDANTVGFQPKERLKSGTEYKVTFAVSELYPEAAGKDKKFSFSFATLQPSFVKEIEGLKLYDDDEPDIYYLQGNVITADYMDNEKVEQVLQVETAGKPASITWQHNERIHRFETGAIKSADAPYNIILRWNGQPVGYDYTAVDTIVTPGKNEFKILSVKIVAEENKIACLFSLPLDARQKYASYVQVQDMEKLRFSTQSNKLEIYLPYKPLAPVTLTLREGLKSKNGAILAEDYTQELVFEELKPAVELIGKGVIMPSSTGLTLPFRAVNLKAVDVYVYRTYENNILQFLQINNLNGERELYRVAKPIAKKTIPLTANKSLDIHQWNTFSIDLASIIAPEPGAIYTVKIKFSQAFSAYSRCPGAAGEIAGSYLTENIPNNLPDASADDYYYYDYGYGYCSENPCDNAYYCEQRFVTQNILATDVGLVAKRGGDRQYLVFVTNLITAEPMSGVKVMLYNYQQQKIAETTSDGNGVAQLHFNDTPYIIVAQDGAQKSYLRIGDELSLSLSMFDVAGASVEKGLKGFIYGERGVWRPGDTLFLTFVLEDRTNQLPKNHPVTFELYNVQGQLVNRQVRTEGQHGFYTFACPTAPDAPTGDWHASVKVGGVNFNKSLRIATVKPNRLKIETSLDEDPVRGDYLKGAIKARWLHGAKTGGNEADITVHLNPVHTAFTGYDDYAFDDITKYFSSTEKERRGQLDENGVMNFNIPLETDGQPAGKLRASVAVRVFEEGGEFSADHFAVEVYPYPSYVGLKMPEGTGYYKRLETDREQQFEVVALDALGKPLKRTLEVEIYRNEWNWWWFSSDGNLANHSSSIYKNLLHTTKVKTDANGKGAFTYKMNYPDWGLFLIKVTDPESGHSVTQKAYIDWWGYGRGQDDDNSGVSILSFHTDKNKYNIGENAIVTIPSADGAKVIVTVENGARVLASYRLDCKGEETQVTIPATAEMTPNAYIFVTLLQPHRQTKNDLPMRLYGVIPLIVEDPATHIHPEIRLPDVIRPEQPFKVSVKEAQAKEMTYTLAIVDEGLLDLTRFKTPDLWNHFFQREALGVRTWDLYNFVLGAYGGKIEQLFAIGGGDDLAEDNGSERTNRFKPVVKFAGPFTLKAGKTNEHTFTLSNYVGSVRAMVIAGNGAGYGKTDKTAPVRSPLMVQATLPRVLGPAEEVTLPVTVFAMEKHVKNVKIELAANDLFEPLDGVSRSLTFADTGDEIVTFRLRVKNKLGAGRVKVTATAGNERAGHDIEIAVRAANPEVIVTKNSIVQGNQTASLTLDAPGIAGTNAFQLEVSGIPPLNLGMRLNYLLAYPHGCLEQTTSGVFPQLFLPEVVAMSQKDKDRAATNIKAGLTRLTYFVKPDGSFSYWPGGTGYGCEWTNSYAGHFMVEAERRGYAIPGNMLENWIAFQQKAARNWNPATTGSRYAHYQNDLVQAYRLYVLALAKKPELSAMNRLRERAGISAQAGWMLASAYSAAGQQETAKALIAGRSVADTEKYNGSSNTYGSAERDDAIKLDALTLTDDKERSFLLAQRISDAMNSGRWMSTQTTAYCLLGLSKYALSERGSLHFAYSVNNGKTETCKEEKSLWNGELGQRDGTAAVNFENRSGNTLFVRLTAKGIPPQGEEKETEKDLYLFVRYFDREDNTLSVDKLPQGTDFEAEVRIMNPGLRGDYTNMALTQIFPSGWEITENRLEDNIRNDGLTYRDIRDDRVLSYFDLKAGKTLVTRIKLRAAYTGKFYLPAVACEAMYDASIHANTLGQPTEVL